MKPYLMYSLCLALTLAYNSSWGQKGSASLSTIGQQNPGVIEFQGLIKEMNAGDTLCGSRYESSMVIKVEEVVNPGRNLINSIAKDQELTLPLATALVKKLRADKLFPKKGQYISVIAKEKLCRDASQSILIALILEQM